MRESMARLTPRFSADRTVREYTEQHYIPAAAAFRQRAADKGAVGRQMVNWRNSLEQQWATLHFGELQVSTHGEQHIFGVEVGLNGLDPNAVRVELYADGVNGDAPVRHEMKRVRQLADASASYVYSAALPSARPPTDCTVRIIPQYAGAAIPLEDARILWRR
jgi:starch phosphorylase